MWRVLLPLLLGMGVLVSMSVAGSRKRDVNAQDAPSVESRAASSQPAPVARGAAERISFSNGDLQMVASARGARLVSVRLRGFALEAGASKEEKSDPSRALELAYHSGAPFSAMSLFVPAGIYRRDPSDALYALDSLLETADWSMTPIAADDDGGAGVAWSLRSGPLTFEKRVRLAPHGWRAEVELRLSNSEPTLQSGNLQLLFVPGGWLFSDHDQYFPSPTAYAGLGRLDDAHVVAKHAAQVAPAPIGADPVQTDLAKTSPDPFLFLADGNKYFVSALVPREPKDAAVIASARAFAISFTSTRGEERRIASAAQLLVRIPAPGDPLSLRYHAYFGPKHDAEFGDLEVLSEIERYDRNSWFSIDVVSRALVGVLRFFAGIVGNWGVAIILLTLCVRALIFPINRKSQAQMARYAKQQQALRPKLEEITKRYKNNARKLNEERIKLFKENNVSMSAPLVGCLPAFLQLPIFVGIFSAVRNTYELRHAPFIGWIHDLSQPDNLIPFVGKSFALPLVGAIHGLNILPLVVMVLWMVSMRLAPKPTDPQQQQVQKMMMFMPIVFGITLYNYASGLALYMGTSSLSSIVEQTIIKKFWPPPGTVAGAPVPITATA